MKNAMLIAAVCAAAVAGPAHAATINFANLTGANGDAFVSYKENGFTVAADTGSPKVGTSYGDPAPNVYFDFTSSSSGSLSVVSNMGSLFTFSSVDLSSGASSSSISSGYTITGFLGGVQQFIQSGSVAGGSGNTFKMISSVAPTFNIDRLVILENTGTGSLTANVDNIVVARVMSAVPEPATWGMMILGFGAVGFAMRRRVRASEVKFA